MTEDIAALPLDKAGDGHDSDCSTHNMPAYLNGPCDCGNPNRPPLIAADDHIPDATQDGDRVALARATTDIAKELKSFLPFSRNAVLEEHAHTIVAAARILGEQP